MDIEKSLVHIILQCKQCSFHSDDYMNAVKFTEDHIKETGHTVIGEFGYSVTIKP